MLVFIWANVTTAASGVPVQPAVIPPDIEGGLTVARHWERGLKAKKQGRSARSTLRK